jgi:DUF971 family protein
MSDNDLETRHWPTDIRISRQEKWLEIDFDSGERFRLPAELLRVESPSAEVQGHGRDQKTLVSGRRHVGIIDVKLVGKYAIRIGFDDLHDTGIYSWRYLYKLGQEQDEIWEKYLDGLDRAGLSRDP